MDAQQNEYLDIKSVTTMHVPVLDSGNFIVVGFVSSFQIFNMFSIRNAKAAATKL